MNSGEKTPTKQELVVNLSKELYRLSGLEDQVDYKIKNIKLKTLPGFISVLEGGFDNEDVLFMIHGYGGPSALHFKLFPELFKKFHVYSMDLYGFGGSYRYDIQFKDSDHAMDVFLRSIHETIEALELKNYYIVSQSMGSYLTFHYQHKYSPENVKGVMLLSPAGSTLMTPEIKKKILSKTYNNSFFKRNMLKLAIYLVFEKQWSPLSLTFFFPNDYIFRKQQLSDPIYKFTENEQELTIKYYTAHMNYGGQGMAVLGHFLYQGNFSKKPSSVYFNEVMTKYNFVVFFGDKDWMKADPFRRMIKQLPQNHKCKDVQIINKCGHNMIIQNPKAVNEQIFKFCKIFKEKDDENFEKLQVMPKL